MFYMLYMFYVFYMFYMFYIERYFFKKNYLLEDYWEITGGLENLENEKMHEKSGLPQVLESPGKSWILKSVLDSP